MKVPGYELLLPTSWDTLGKARVVVYVKKSLQFEQIPALQDPQVQSIWIRAGFKNMKKIYFSHQ